MNDEKLIEVMASAIRHTKAKDSMGLIGTLLTDGECYDVAQAALEAYRIATQDDGK